MMRVATEIKPCGVKNLYSTRGILVILLGFESIFDYFLGLWGYFGNYHMSRAFWSLLGFMGILVILKFWGVFRSFLRIMTYFCHF